MTAPTEVLLLHDGELSDLTALLDELDVSWAEGRSGRAVEGGAPLVIGTPTELLRFRSDDGATTARIAICSSGGKTLEGKLEADGVDFVLRRPVHPAALRLLILHLIYRGPERRRLRRVNAAIPITFRAGWRRRHGLLLEFSVGGCSLLTDRPLAAGQRIKATLPAELGLGRKLKVHGRVVRCAPAPSARPGEHVAAIDFGELTPDAHQRLAAAVVARARQVAPPVEAPVPPPRTGEASAPAHLAEVEERRSMPRGQYTKAIHGQVAGEQIVLMGSNLSPAGMRIDPEPRLGLGVTLKLDLYGHGDIPPLRLQARVARDDGEQGLYLEFQDLWPGAPALIERLIKTLPVVSPQAGGMVITEVIESR
jgi:hypothetical protein